MTRHLAGTGIGILVALLFLALPGNPARAEVLCTDCHKTGNLAPKPPMPHDAGCSNTTCQESCHPKQLVYLSHNAGPNTPITGDRTTTCNACHNQPFAGVYHPYTINATAATTPAGSVDVDDACGRCHAAGMGGPYFSKANLLLVAEGMHDWALEQYASTFVSVAPFDRYPDPTTCAAAGGAWVNGSICDVNKLSIRVTPAVNCGAGVTCPPFTYDWNWGDGTSTMGSANASEAHTYATAGTFSVKVLVRQADGDKKRVSSVTRSFTLANPNLPPTALESASAPCAFDANTWTYTLTDASSDDGPDEDTAPGDGEATLQVVVDWGDGTSKTFGRQGQPFSHVYARTGTFAVRHTVTDGALQSHISVTCTAAANPAYFTLGGIVYKKGGVLPLQGAAVVVKRGTAFSRTVTSSATGAFSVGNLVPGTYSITVSKIGYTFTPATYSIGPSSTAIVLSATAP